MNKVTKKTEFIGRHGSARDTTKCAAGLWKLNHRNVLKKYLTAAE